jgi:hypothetical protein
MSTQREIKLSTESIIPLRKQFLRILKQYPTYEILKHFWVSLHESGSEMKWIQLQTSPHYWFPFLTFLLSFSTLVPITQSDKVSSPSTPSSEGASKRRKVQRQYIHQQKIPLKKFRPMMEALESTEDKKKFLNIVLKTRSPLDVQDVAEIIDWIFNSEFPLELSQLYHYNSFLHRQVMRAGDARLIQHIIQSILVYEKEATTPPNPKLVRLLHALGRDAEHLYFKNLKNPLSITLTPQFPFFWMNPIEDIGSFTKGYIAGFYKSVWFFNTEEEDLVLKEILLKDIVVQLSESIGYTTTGNASGEKKKVWEQHIHLKVDERQQHEAPKHCQQQKLQKLHKYYKYSKDITKNFPFRMDHVDISVNVFMNTSKLPLVYIIPYQTIQCIMQLYRLNHAGTVHVGDWRTWAFENFLMPWVGGAIYSINIVPIVKSLLVYFFFEQLLLLIGDPANNSEGISFEMLWDSYHENPMTSIYISSKLSLLDTIASPKWNSEFNNPDNLFIERFVIPFLQEVAIHHDKYNYDWDALMAPLNALQQVITRLYLMERYNIDEIIGPILSEMIRIGQGRLKPQQRRILQKLQKGAKI